MPKQPSSPPPPPTQDPLLRDVPSLEGHKVLGRIVLLEQIGAGGMGVVYRGFHLSYGIEVAVKVLLPSLAADREFIARFCREAQAALRITHQNVVRAYGVEEAHGLFFFVMELVDGESARQRVKRRGRMQPREALAAVTGVAAGLAEAHREGLVHRDIKPANLMLARSGRVKLADLGLIHPAVHASARAASGTPYGGVGTPRYMAPECWDGALPHPTQDVWALGATLYYLVTGNHALPRLPSREMRQYVRDNPLPTLAFKLADLPGFDAIYERCVARDPRDRFQSGRELHAALVAVGPADESLLRQPDAEAGHRVEVPPDAVLDRIEAALARPVPRETDEPRRRRQRPARRTGGAISTISTLIAVAAVVACVVMYLRMQGNDAPQAPKKADPKATAGAGRSEPGPVDVATPQPATAPTDAAAKGAVGPTTEVRGDLEVALDRVAHDGSLVGRAPGAARVRAQVASRTESVADVAADGRFTVRLFDELPLASDTFSVRIEVVAIDAAGRVSRPATSMLGALVREPVVRWRSPPIGAMAEGPTRIEFDVESLFATDSVTVQGRPLAASDGTSAGHQSRWSHTVDVPPGGTVVKVDVVAAGKPGGTTTLPVGVLLLGKPIQTTDGIAMVFVPGGAFAEGSTSTDVAPFWIGETEISRAQWNRLEPLPSGHDGSARADGNAMPITEITVEQAEAFCEKLTRRENDAGRLPQGYHYALPTELLRRFVARGHPPEARVLPLQDAPQPVDRGERVGLGVRCFHGNVAEWCSGGADARFAVARGGSYCDFLDGDDTIERLPLGAKKRRIGFRVVLVPRS